MKTTHHKETVATHPVSTVTIDASLTHRDPAIGHGHFRRRHGQLCEAVRPPNIFRILENGFGIEPAHFPTDAAIIRRRIERFDFMNPADSVLQTRPKGLEIVADGRDCTQSGYDDAAVVVH